MDFLLALLPQAFTGPLADFDRLLGLPRGVVSLVVLLLSLLIPAVLLFGKKTTSGTITSRKKDTVLLLGECKAGKTVMFHQVRAVGPALLPALACPFLNVLCGFGSLLLAQCLLPCHH